MNSSLAQRIDALLPQTQCTRCGYPTCHAYAEAIAQDSADINRCPPGGTEGVTALAELLDREPKPLNPANGLEGVPTVAFIDENVCIGCMKCIQVCPVDAIVGAAKRMHTIIANECTGCGLCLPPCPVDCIALSPVAEAPLMRTQVLARAAQSRERFDARNARIGAASPDVVGAAAAAMPEPSLPNSPGPQAQPSGVHRRADRWSASASLHPLEGEGVNSIAAAAAPISRSAVLEAIARGKARRQSRLKDPPSR